MKKSVLEILLGFVVSCMFAALMALVLVNWVMGCGEVFYYPDGSWVTGDCFLIPYEPVSGRQ